MAMRLGVPIRSFRSYGRFLRPVITAVLVSLLPSATVAAATEPRLDVEVSQGTFSLVAESVALDEVLRKIGQEAGFEVEIAGELNQPLSLSLTDQPIVAGLRRLLARQSSIFIHHPESQVLARVIAWDPAEGTPNPIASSNGTAPRPLSAASQGLRDRQSIDLRDHSLDREARLSMLEEVAADPSEAQVATLAFLLGQDDDAAIRRVAAIGLSKTDGPNARKALVRALRDPDAQVRRRALQGLGRLDGSLVVAAIAKALHRDREPEIRETAAHLLGRIGGAEAKRALQLARNDQVDSVQRAVAKSLSTLETAEQLNRN